MSERIQLKDLYNLTNSIFTDLQSFDVPWKTLNINQKLDIAYMGNQSGQKFISPLVKQFVNNGALSSADRATIASVVYALNNDNWSKLYDTLSFEYDPIENYHMEEKHTGTETDLDTPTNWEKTIERTPDLTKTETQTPTNWKETETQTPTNWKETETQTPTNWKETETKTPTNWTETETQTPTDWEKTTTESFTNYHETETVTPEDKETVETETFTNYHETETQTPTDWQKQTSSIMADNGGKVENKVVPFNSNSPLLTSQVDSQTKSDITEEQIGTYETDKEFSGSKAKTTTESGTLETDKTITGTKTTSEEQTGTFQTEKTQSGTFQTEKAQSGTFQTETSHTGTFETESVESGTDTTTETQAGTYEKKTTYNTTLTRSGNIGTMTSQQMIESERMLWVWNFFYKVVFPDVDKVLTLAIY